MIKNLPKGIRHVGGNASPKKAKASGRKTNESGQEPLYDSKNNTEGFFEDMKDVIKIGQFEVNIGMVSCESIKAMRTYLPREEYRLLKNRKSAR